MTALLTKKAQKAAEVAANKKIAFAKRLATLTGHVAKRITAVEMDAAALAGMTADEFAYEIAAREPVGRALHTQKAEAIKAAAMDAAATIGRLQLILEEHGWDINAAAPYPDSLRCGRSEYQRMKARRSLFSSVVENVEKGYRHYRKGEPQIVEMSETGIARFIEQAEQTAALQYDMFICKMVHKVGESVVDATISGEHVWGHSILTVTLKDGTAQRWKTQQIINTSVHGLRFPQWPSRIIK